MASALAKLINSQLVGVALIAVVISGPCQAEEPCNPIVDGTYCATQMPKKSASTSSSRGMNPIRPLGSEFGWSSSQDPPGTLGSISFRGSGTCFGSIIRSRCS
ncbi:MAG: hypothetical protein K2X60_12370 [Xanthobacteraceae bacterium]|nr:hypothetical protein [Xanthobacteraceae bacterium]